MEEGLKINPKVITGCRIHLGTSIKRPNTYSKTVAVSPIAIKSISQKNVGSESSFKENEVNMLNKGGCM